MHGIEGEPAVEDELRHACGSAAEMAATTRSAALPSTVPTSSAAIRSRSCSERGGLRKRRVDPGHELVEVARAQERTRGGETPVMVADEVLVGAPLTRPRTLVPEHAYGRPVVDDRVEQDRPGVRDHGRHMLEQRRELLEVRVARLLHGDPFDAERGAEPLGHAAVARVRAKDKRVALRRTALAPPADQPFDELALERRVVRRVAGEEDEGPRGVEPEPREQGGVLLTRTAAVIDVGLRPARDRDLRRVDRVVALELAAHRLVLDDVEVEVRRDDALPDRVVPARDVADNGDAELARCDEVRHRHVRLEVRDDEARAAATHRLEERLSDIAVRREQPAAHDAVDDLPTRQVPCPVDVEERDRVSVLPALAVEAHTQAVTHGDGVEPDVVVEEDVGAPDDPFVRRNLLRGQRRRLEHAQPVELGKPGLDVLRMEREERRDPVIERVAEARDDAAIEEDAVGEWIDESEPEQRAEG